MPVEGTVRVDEQKIVGALDAALTEPREIPRQVRPALALVIGLPFVLRFAFHRAGREGLPMSRKCVSVASLFFILIAVSFLGSQVGAGQDQTPSNPQAWDAGTRYPDWEGTSTLEIVNECKKEHLFSLTKKDADFLDFQFTQPIRVPGHKSVTVPVRFHTDGMTPGIYSGLVTILCTDCTEVPPCMQDRRTVAPRIRVLPRQAPGPNETTPASPEKTTPPVTPPTKPTGDSSAKEKPAETAPPVTPPAKPGDHPPTQEKPPQTPNTVEVKKGCCCCVDDLELLLKSHARVFEKPTELVWKRDENGDWIQVPRTREPTFGHEFKVIIRYHKKRITEPGEEPGDCVLKWLEKSHNPPKTNLDAGAKVDEWNDIGVLMGNYYHKYIEDDTTLGPWYDPKKEKYRKEQCPIPPNPGAPPAKIELTDKPAILYGNDRILYFHIIVESAPHCTKLDKNKKPEACPKKELWAKQVLDTDPGNKNSKFYVSDDGGQTWTEAKIK